MSFGTQRHAKQCSKIDKHFQVVLLRANHGTLDRLAVRPIPTLCNGNNYFRSKDRDGRGGGACTLRGQPSLPQNGLTLAEPSTKLEDVPLLERFSTELFVRGS